MRTQRRGITRGTSMHAQTRREDKSKEKNKAGGECDPPRRYGTKRNQNKVDQAVYRVLLCLPRGKLTRLA